VAKVAAYDEVALSLVLATAASLLGYSLIKLRNTPLGFDPRGLVFFTTEGKVPLFGPKLLLENEHPA
jgi:hypothetical protein